MAELVTKLHYYGVYTVEMLLECTLEDLIEGPDDKKIQRPTARVLLRKAKEITDQPLNTSQPPPDDDNIILIPIGALDGSLGSD